MTAGTNPARPSVRAALDAARVVFGTAERDGTGAAPVGAPALWASAQQVLQCVLDRPELTGQALVGEARKLGVLTLADAHALVGLSSWADRTSAPAATETERTLVREAMLALEHAVAPSPASSASSASPYAPPSASSTSPSAAPSSSSASSYQSSSAASASSAGAWSPPPASARADHDGGSLDPMLEVTTPRRGLPPAALLGVLVLLIAAAAGGWWWMSGRKGHDLDEGVAAYQRGAREAARVAFAKAAQDNPDDARPLVYLGRMTREDGDLPRARRFLTTAVRLAPRSSVAARELAGVMLADGQPELARRFYVRALELDPADRVAQGFLGCALARLQRLDEARRWIDRAGPGDWQRCLPVMPPMPMPMPMAPAVPPR
jgi:tetratricopeptide (TPR) repeat protein